MECGTTLDPRTDRDLFDLTQQATALIPKLFHGVRLELDSGGLPRNFAHVWLAYLAAEVYGNADAAVIAVLHNRGRQAQILERQLFECQAKAEYYIVNANEARLEFLAWPFREKKLMDDLQVERTAIRYVAAGNAISRVSEKYPEVLEYAAKYGFKERPFAEMLGDMNNPDVRKHYAFQYRRKSQTPHGSITGMSDVLEFNESGFIIKFDSRLDNPNMALAEIAMHLIYFLDLLDQQLGANRWTEIEPLDKRLNDVIARL
jgi:hypothetical protein